MKANVRKELDVLLEKVAHWKNSYLKEVEGKNDEWLIDELKEDIATWMAPYVLRLEETKHITRQESDDFWREVGKSFREFIKDIEAGKRIEQKTIVDVPKLLSQFKVHKKLIEGNYINHEFQVEQKIKLADIAMILVPALEKS